MQTQEGRGLCYIRGEFHQTSFLHPRGGRVQIAQPHLGRRTEDALPLPSDAASIAPRLTAVPRSRWGEIAGDVEIRSFATVFDRVSFDADKIFVVYIEANHAGTETWPMPLILEMRYPMIAAMMDYEFFLKELKEKMTNENGTATFHEKVAAETQFCEHLLAHPKMVAGLTEMGCLDRASRLSQRASRRCASEQHARTLPTQGPE